MLSASKPSPTSLDQISRAIASGSLDSLGQAEPLRAEEPPEQSRAWGDGCGWRGAAASRRLAVRSEGPSERAPAEFVKDRWPCHHEGWNGPRG
jgi:hypothetical protein